MLFLNVKYKPNTNKKFRILMQITRIDYTNIFLWLMNYLVPIQKTASSPTKNYPRSEIVLRLQKVLNIEKQKNTTAKHKTIYSITLMVNNHFSTNVALPYLCFMWSYVKNLWYSDKVESLEFNVQHAPLRFAYDGQSHLLYTFSTIATELFDIFSTLCLIFVCYWMRLFAHIMIHLFK